MRFNVIFKLKVNKGALFTITVAILFLVLSGCVKTISHSELMNIPKGTEVNTLPTLIWYMGSKDEYDYFNVGIGKGTGSLSPMNQEYKVASENTEVTERFKLTNDQSKWREYPTYRYIPDPVIKVIEPSIGPRVTDAARR